MYIISYFIRCSLFICLLSLSEEARIKRSNDNFFPGLIKRNRVETTQFIFILKAKTIARLIYSYTFSNTFVGVFCRYCLVNVIIFKIFFLQSKMYLSLLPLLKQCPEHPESKQIDIMAHIIFFCVQFNWSWGGMKRQKMVSAFSQQNDLMKFDFVGRFVGCHVGGVLVTNSICAL